MESSDAKQFKADIESRVAQLDDNAAGPLVLPGLSVYVADTLAEAEQKVAALNVYTDIEKKIHKSSKVSVKIQLNGI